MIYSIPRQLSLSYFQEVKYRWSLPGIFMSIQPLKTQGRVTRTLDPFDTATNSARHMLGRDEEVVGAGRVESVLRPGKTVGKRHSPVPAVHRGQLVTVFTS